MTIIRTRRKRHNFSVIDNTGLRDNSLGWKATGMLAFLMTKPDDWKINVDNLSKAKQDGRDSTIATLDALKEAGYIHFRRYRVKGRFESEYIVFETKEDLQEWAEKEGLNSEDPETENHDEDDDATDYTKLNTTKASSVTEKPQRKNHDGKTTTEKPLRENRDGETATENPTVLINKEVITEKLITEELITPPTPSEEVREEETAKNWDNAKNCDDIALEPEVLLPEDLSNPQNPLEDRSDKTASLDRDKNSAAIAPRRFESSCQRAENMMRSRQNLPNYRNDWGRGGIKKEFLIWFSLRIMPPWSEYKHRTPTIFDADSWVKNKESKGSSDIVEVRYEQMIAEQLNPEIAEALNSQNLIAAARVKAKQQQTKDLVREALEQTGGFF